MGYKFLKDEGNKLKLTISKNRISVNRDCHKTLGEPEFVKIGLSTEGTPRIAIVPSKEGEQDGCFRLSINNHNRTANISRKQVARDLLNHIERKIEGEAKSIYLAGEFDEEENMVVFS